eukprot:7458850-Alexandrium_andersonii.AAC.1
MELWMAVASCLAETCMNCNGSAQPLNSCWLCHVGTCRVRAARHVGVAQLVHGALRPPACPQ